MDFKAERARLLAQLSGEIKDRRVLAAMAKVPREIFVREENRRLAYENRPLSIGLGQTISQPLIVGLMTEALTLKGDERVLEVGTGSGYQAAVLAELARSVVTVERLPILARQARTAAESLGYQNIEFHIAREELGWSPAAPYDAIIVTAAAPHIPIGLVDQLKIGGRLVIPVGSRYLQELCVVTHHATHNHLREVGACRFVSLIGKGAWAEETIS